MASVNRDVVDSGDLRYAFTWMDRDGSILMNSNRTVITSADTSSSSTLSLSPLSSRDTMFSCSVVVSESQNILQSSNAGIDSISVSPQSKFMK